MSEEGYLKSLKVLEEIRTISQDIGKLLSEKKLTSHTGGPLSYYLENLQRYAEALFTQHSKLRVGDRVKLVRTLTIPEKSGWYGSRHMLVEGALATVHAIDWSSQSNTFVADIVFDIESWIDNDGKERPVMSKHTFYFKHCDLDKVSAEEEQSLIKEEEDTKRKIRLFSDIQEILLENKTIDKPYNLSDYNKLGNLFSNSRDFVGILNQVSTYLSIPKNLRTEDKWKELSLFEFIDQIM